MYDSQPCGEDGFIEDTCKTEAIHWYSEFEINGIFV